MFQQQVTHQPPHEVDGAALFGSHFAGAPDEFQERSGESCLHPPGDFQSLCLSFRRRQVNEVSAGDDTGEMTFLDDGDLPPACPDHERSHTLGGVLRRDCDLARLHDAAHRLLSPLVLQCAIHGVAGDQSHDAALIIHDRKALVAGVEHTVGDILDGRLRRHGTDAVGHQFPHGEARVYEAGQDLP